MTDLQNSFKTSEHYRAYCRNTNEKTLLIQHIREQLGEQDISSILDVGSGNGLVTVVVADTFPNASVDAVERSPVQIAYARQHNARPNITYHQKPFEDFETGQSYDFVLASHVLQYIDSGLEAFVRKGAAQLAPAGEFWIVQQTRMGMAQIIEHQRDYLADARFFEWKTFEDYEVELQRVLKEEYVVKVGYLKTSFVGFNFSNPSAEDKLRLEFIFCLDAPFDMQSVEFKEHLAKLHLGWERIEHPNGILRIKKRQNLVLEHF